MQEDNAVSWVHEDPVTKTKKRTNASGAVTSTTLVDPWGGEVSGPWVENPTQQKHKFTTYERNVNLRDEAQQRSYHAWLSRFDQPDPWDGSYALTDPQSFNRYAYTQSDPVNFVDPSGLNMAAGGGGCWVSWKAMGQFIDNKLVSISDFSYTVTCGGGRGGGGGVSGAPQNTDSKDNHRDDCLAFAAIVDDLARKAKTDTTFIKNLYSLLSGDREGKVYRSRGFAREFTDEVGDGNNSPNQVRHATGAITAGFAGGVAFRTSPANTLNVTLESFNERERSYAIIVMHGAGLPTFRRVLLPPTASEAADLRLNSAALPIGYLLGAGQISRNMVGDMIRKTICNH